MSLPFVAADVRRAFIEYNDFRLVTSAATRIRSSKREILYRRNLTPTLSHLMVEGESFSGCRDVGSRSLQNSLSASLVNRTLFPPPSDGRGSG